MPGSRLNVRKSGKPDLRWGGVGVGVARLQRSRRHTHHPPPHPSPTRGEGADRVRRSRSFPFARRETWSESHRNAALVGAGLMTMMTMMMALADLAGAETGLRPYAVVGDAIPAPLTGTKGDPERGRTIVVNRQVGLCLLCHSGPFPDERFQGTLAPNLKGAGSRSSEGQLRLRIVEFEPPQPGHHHAILLPGRWPYAGGAGLSR